MSERYEELAREWLDNEDLCGYPEDSTKDARLSALLRRVAEEAQPEEGKIDGIGSRNGPALSDAQVQALRDSEMPPWPEEGK